MKISYEQLDFIIVGPGHTGSTWLGTQLRKTKDIYATHECNWLTWSSMYSNQEFSSYFNGAEEKLIFGEHGNTYFAHPETPRLMHLKCPNAKIIFVYRDPLKRAIAHFFHDRRYGTISRRLSVKYVLFPDFFYNRYIEESLYGKHLARYLDYFPSENIYIFASPANNNNLGAQFSDLLSFLRGGGDFNMGGEFYKRINSRKTPLIPYVHWYSIFGKNQLARSLAGYIDSLNCAVGSMLYEKSLTQDDEDLFAKTIKLAERGDFIEICKNNKIRGVEYISGVTSLPT